MGLIELTDEFADIMWRVAARARELESRLGTEIELPALQRELAAIVASIGA